MYKAAAAKYKAIYNNKVLPKKSVTENTQAIFEKSLEVMEDFSYFRNKANEAILGGYGNERDKK